MKDKRHTYKPMRALLLSYFELWIHSPRTILMGLVLLATTYVTVYSYGKGLAYFQYSMHLGESIVWFSMTGFNSISLSSLTFLVAVSELPRRIPFQQYSIMRISRKKWMLSLILYCFLMVIAVILLITVFAAIFLLQYTTPGDGWSDTIRIQNGMAEELAYIPSWIRENYQPWQAALLALVPIFFFWIAMVLTILFFSVIGHPSIGVSIFAVILFSGLIFVFENFPNFQPPMTFSTLVRIVSKHEGTYAERLSRVFIGYIGLIVGQVFAMVLVSRRVDIPTYSLEKD